jgi:hypothetical protein
MSLDPKESLWTLQEFATVAGRPWFALQLQSDGGVELPFTGYRWEMDDVAAKLGIVPGELPAITEEDFFSCCCDGEGAYPDG